MAQIKSITYGRTINLGNYESERLEATVELSEVTPASIPIPDPEHYGQFITSPAIMEDPQEAFKELREWVLEQVYAKASAADKLP